MYIAGQPAISAENQEEPMYILVKKSRVWGDILILQRGVPQGKSVDQVNSARFCYCCCYTCIIALCKVYCCEAGFIKRHAVQEAAIATI